MRSYLILCWQISLATLCFGPSIASAFQGPFDLLDPSFDKALPQYQSTTAVSFRERPVGDAAPKLAPAQVSPPSRPPATSPRSVASADDTSGPSVLLAPNPLASGYEQPRLNPPAADSVTLSPPKPAPGKRSVSPAENPSRPKAKRTPAKTKEKASAKKKVAEKSKKKKVVSPRQAEVDYAIYRDLSPLPIDPRKPNNPCTKNDDCQCNACQGLHGRPYQPHEPGGYRCGKNCPNKRPEFSVYWPRPLSVRRDTPTGSCFGYGCQQCESHCGTSKKVNDLFDGLANFRLIDYQRSDNGYCGPEADPYGCLGESKLLGGGYSIPSESIPSEPVVGSYPSQ